MRLHRTRTVASVGALLVGLSLVTSAAARSNDNGKLSNISIDNFGRVNEQYYRGAQPNGHDYADLAALGIKTVIDLTADGDRSEASLVRSAGMAFYRIPMTTHDQPARDAVTEFLGLVTDPKNRPVYVHCQGGRHRTGIMTAVYRMTQDGWTADRAFAEMQRYGFGPAFLHATLKDFVYDYYARLDHPSSAPAQAHVAASAGN